MASKQQAGRTGSVKSATSSFKVNTCIGVPTKGVTDQLILMQLRGSGVRDTAFVTAVSPATVLRCLIVESSEAVVKPRHHRYDKVQIDELWMYVAKKQKKVWLLYAYCYETDEILAFTIGKRSSKTINDLLIKGKGLEINRYLTRNFGRLDHLVLQIVEQ